jgi:GNAT superfamily N-acetyltransferase
MNPASITVRPILSGEEKQVSDLILRLFQEFVGHEYSQEGQERFTAYVTPAALRQRSEHDHFMLGAIKDEEIVGAIEIRQARHLSLLFVDQRFQRKGIARRLLEKALTRVHSENPMLACLSVNASRYAVPAYERLGFCTIAAEEIIHGMIFTPMQLVLNEHSMPAV